MANIDSGQLVYAYFMSVFVGLVVTHFWSELLLCCLKKNLALYFIPLGGIAPRMRWIPALIGVFERWAVTTLMIMAPSATVPFIGGWVALKIAGGWGRFKDPSPVNIALYMLGLLGNAMSFSWAVYWTAFFVPEALGGLGQQGTR